MQAPGRAGARARRCSWAVVGRRECRRRACRCVHSRARCIGRSPRWMSREALRQRRRTALADACEIILSSLVVIECRWGASGHHIVCTVEGESVGFVPCGGDAGPRGKRRTCFSTEEQVLRYAQDDKRVLRTTKGCSGRRSPYDDSFTCNGLFSVI